MGGVRGEEKAVSLTGVQSGVGEVRRSQIPPALWVFVFIQTVGSH